MAVIFPVRAQYRGKSINPSRTYKNDDGTSRVAAATYNLHTEDKKADGTLSVLPIRSNEDPALLGLKEGATYNFDVEVGSYNSITTYRYAGHSEVATKQPAVFPEIQK